MTNKKAVGNIQKRLNQTANRRALNNPQVRKALKSLQAYWGVLSQPEQIERVNYLLGLGCSLQGIAEETRIPLSTIRRHIAPTRSPKPSKDPRPGTKRNSKKESQKRRPPSAIDAAKESQAMFQKVEASRQGTEEKETASEQQQPLTAQPPTITAADSAPIAATELSTKREETGRGGSQTREDKAKTGQRELGEPAPESRMERRQRLARIQIKPRPHYTASSMKRQGTLLPDNDVH